MSAFQQNNDAKKKYSYIEVFYQKATFIGGYADELGETVIPPVYDLAEEFIGGLAHVKKSGRGFHIDKRGLYHRHRNLLEQL